MSPSAGLLDLRPESYQPHPLHDEDRDWPETNCYTDVWIELLHALGQEPLAMGAFTVACEFEGTQWSFFKPPVEDLELLYGVRAGEMNVWRPPFDHVTEELALGRLLIVEVDSWYLPDTVGTSYRTEHVKTSMVPQLVDPVARRIGYFHGRGYHELVGDDYDGCTAQGVLPPYVDLVRLPDNWPRPEELLRRSRALLNHHVRRLPTTNPVTRMGERLELEVQALAGSDPEHVHKVAFATFRQCGSGAGMAAAYLTWLGERTDVDLVAAAGAYEELSSQAKSAQFLLARAARGRTVDLRTPLDAMAAAWARAADALADRCG